MNILEISNLSVEYYRNKKKIPALRNVSLSLKQGETLSIVGESGCGKSTLALSILKLIFPWEGNITSGSVIYKNEDLIKKSDKELENIRGKEISIIFQDPFSSLNPVMKIGEQLSEVIECHNHKISKQEKKELIYKILSDVMLKNTKEILDSYPHQLSGGQRQRVVIAMAIINKPSILIADEPTTALDVTIQREIMNLIDRLKEQLSLTILLITHNLPLASERSDRIAFMYAGEIVEIGSCKDIFSSALHPYAQALISSIPKPCSAIEDINIIPGQPPDLSNLSLGCAFFPRCKKAINQCSQKEPPEKILNNRLIRCFLY